MAEREGEPLHKTVQEQIRNYIINNGLGPGDPIKPEAELARQFGVGRNSVREAVKALESTGVLETRRGSGVFVRNFSFAPLLDQMPYGLMHGSQALRELLALRKALESAMIGDAMTAMRPETEQAIREVLAEMRRFAETGEDFADQDREFHHLLFRDLGNKMLLQLFDLFWMAYNRAAPEMPSRRPIEAYQYHAAILEAVVSGDLRQAEEAVQLHYTGIEDRLRD